MPATRRLPASSGLGHVPNLESSKIDPDRPLPQPSKEDRPFGQDAATDHRERYGEQNSSFHNLSRATPEQKTLGCSLEEAESRGNVMGYCSTKGLFSEMHCRLPERHVESSQQAGSNDSLNLSESFEPGATPLLATGVSQQVVAISVPKAVSGTEDSALAPPVAKRQSLETIGNVQTNKRKREPPLDLSNQGHASESFDDGRRRSKKVKVDCDCDTDHVWWMTIKIDDMNEAIQRLDDGMVLVRELERQSRVITGDLIKLLKNSREMLENAKDDMRAEGGRDGDDSE